MAQQESVVQSSSKRMPFLCVDDSEHCARAVDWYFEHIHQEGNAVGIVHIHIPPELPSLGIFEGSFEARELYQQAIERTINVGKATAAKYEDICRIRGVKCHVFVETVDDSVGHTIINITKKNNASLLVIGQRGLGVIRRTLFGSVSDYVLHHSHIPVLVVPPSEEK